jgi:hypothetical protein
MRASRQTGYFDDKASVASATLKKRNAPADKRLHNNFVRRTPKIPPPYPGALCVDGHDLFILMSVNTVIELDDHPHSMETRPGLQKKEIGYFKSNTH